MPGWRLLSLIGVSAGLVVACGGSDLTVPPTEGAATITTTTTGTEPDPDGYAVQIDANATQPITATGTVQVSSLTPGTHTVLLSGMAANCTVADNPRPVTITAGETATVAFEVTCSPTTGSIRVTTTTSGPSPDADGYTLTLDGTDRGPLASTGELLLDALPAGNHAVGLGGVAGNCRVDGDNPQTVAVIAGETATLALSVTCTAPPANPGALHLSTVTTGADLDADGYSFTVDAGASQTIGANSSTTVSNLSAGQHAVRLSGVSANCTVQGDNPRTVTVVGAATAEVSFAINCTAASGSIRVSVASTGPSTDPDGYTVKLDNANPGQTVAATGTVTFSNVPAGPHSIAISGVDSRCTVTGASSQNVIVSVAAVSEVAFAITCSTPGPLPSKILFQSDQPGNFDIFSIDPDGTNQTDLTNSAGDDIHPRWSPDGRKIAFEGDHPGADIFTMNADGTGLTNLTGSTGHGGEPKWSPDGSKIAFLSGANADFDIFVMNADGSGRTNLTKLAKGDMFQNWSPDGSRITFTRGVSIFVMNSDGSGQKALTIPGENEEDQFAEWSPDGRRIAFIRSKHDANEAFVTNLWVMNPDGSGAKALTNYQLGPGPDVLVFGFSWSPDGNRIAYDVDGDIHVVGADGTGDTNVTNGSPLRETQPRWSPDGQKIEFSAVVGDASDLFVMNADGSQSVNLTNNPAHEGEAAWRP
jgi:Tol biopolymer transport system component